MCRSIGMSVTNRVGVEDANWLLSLAELPHLEKMVPLAGGWDNTNFLLHLADGSKVVLKAWFANRVEEVHRVILRHIHLDSHGIPTTVPIKLYDDRSFAEKNGVAWTLLPYIQGGHLGKDSQSLVSLGKELARMHEIPVSECFPREYRMGFTLFDKVASLSKDGGPDVSFVRLLASESSAIKSNLPKEIPIGVLHGDLFPDNIIGKGGVRAILDLEEAWIGPKIFDLVMAFVGFGWEGTEPIFERWESLVGGYQSIRILGDKEIEALPTMHRYATLSIACWRYWKHNLADPNEGLSKRYVEMVDRLGVEFDF